MLAPYLKTTVLEGTLKDAVALHRPETTKKPTTDEPTAQAQTNTKEQWYDKFKDAAPDLRTTEDAIMVYTLPAKPNEGDKDLIAKFIAFNFNEKFTNVKQNPTNANYWIDDMTSFGQRDDVSYTVYNAIFTADTANELFQNIINAMNPFSDGDDLDYLNRIVFHNGEKYEFAFQYNEKVVKFDLKDYTEQDYTEMTVESFLAAFKRGEYRHDDLTKPKAQAQTASGKKLFFEYEINARPTFRRIGSKAVLQWNFKRRWPKKKTQSR